MPSIRVTNLLALIVLSLGKFLSPVQSRTLISFLSNQEKESCGKLKNVFLIVRTVLFKFHKKVSALWYSFYIGASLSGTMIYNKISALVE